MERLLSVLAFVLLVAACTTTTTVNGVVVPNGDGATTRQEADPRRRAEVRLQLAANYFQSGQTAIALEETQRAIAADPDYAAARALLGLIYLNLGDRRGAEASFADARRLAPDDPEIDNNYGWFLCQTGRERESIAFFERAAANRLYRTPAMALQNAGICMLRVNDNERAEAYLRQSFQMDASNPVTKYQLARLALANRQIDRAVFYYGLLESEQNKPSAMLWLGVRIARANGDVRVQRQLASELNQRYPNSPETAALIKGNYDE
jgi:type IV pilus assembly protein PilF